MAGYPEKDKGYQQWITDLQLIATDAPSGSRIIRECLEIAEMLINKNISYGDSALSPIRIFSQADNQEQIKIRIDDKINRIKNGVELGRLVGTGITKDTVTNLYNK